MNIPHAKQFIQILGFKLQDGESGVWYKEYNNHNNYKISVKLEDTLNKSIIDFGNKIKKGRNTTTNLSQAENLVVLECMDRLLGKGYKPGSIFLEKSWQLGHKGKGFLDIQVLDNSGKSFLMIECKTWGKEYGNAKKSTEKDGGQLFSYLIQEKSTQYACLYASTMEENKINYQSDIIVISEEIKNAENQQEAFEAWLPQVFETKGLFEPEDEPYKIEFKGILKKELKPLTEKDGGDIFNRFSEILRKNVVSDKTNAFNKIFNLFLCKIVDEFERQDDEPVKFQWREDEKNEDVMLRLNDLYKRGMDLYLGLKIEAVTKKELDDVLKNLKNEDNIKTLFIRQKLYSGNEFAFKEVFDKKTFENNCVVVREAVNLLEKYKIKYATKQQFLGDFFENLLNTGIKQESGQFFTPIPIAQFICKSIPLMKIIKSKNEEKEPYFLPYVIDYASGSGHFLTEIMEEIDNHIKDFDENNIKCGEKYKKRFARDKDNFLWAEEYIYGIEKDYRLAKTTKISTFLNGDGDAQIICADGLDNFETSEDFRGKLKILESKKDNKQFDVVVANPPYSVDGFKTTINNGKETFDLYSGLTDQSSEIECLFIERTKQLLKVGGVAGIILPISILTNGGIYSRTREIIFKYFDIISIAEMGSSTFMATGTKTVILFLKRKDDNEWLNIQETINKFFINNKDVSCNGIENVFSSYINFVFGDLSMKDYVSFFNNKPTKTILKHVLIKEYLELYDNLDEEKQIKAITKAEKEKMLYFILSYDKDLVLIKAPNGKNEEKEFLGYEFSTRRGHEGIRIFKDENGENISRLYNTDPNDLYDENKLNSYILKIFENKDIDSISEDLKNVLQIQKMHDKIDFERIDFDKKITTEFSKKKIKNSKWELAKLDDICEVIDNGTNAPQEKKYFKNGTYPFIRAGNLNFKDSFNYVISDKNSFINDLAVEECSLKKFKAETVLFAKSGQSSKTNNIAKLKNDSYVVNHLACIYSSDKILNNYIYYFFEDFETSNLIPIDSNYPSINITDIKNFKIPLPPKNVQKEFVENISKIEIKQDKLLSSKNEIMTEINDLANNFKGNELKLNDLVSENRAKFIQGVTYNKNDQARSKTVNRVYTASNIDLDKKELTTKEEVYLKSTVNLPSEKKLIKNDIFVCTSSGSIKHLGKSVFISKNIDGYFGGFCAVLRINDNILAKYIYYLLNTDSYREFINGFVGQNINNLNRKILNFKIPIPESSKLKTTVRKFEELEKKISKINDSLEKLKDEKNILIKKYL